MENRPLERMKIVKVRGPVVFFADGIELEHLPHHGSGIPVTGDKCRRNYSDFSSFLKKEL